MGGNGALPPSPLHKSINQEGPAISKLQIGKLRFAGAQWRDRALALPFLPSTI